MDRDTRGHGCVANHVGWMEALAASSRAQGLRSLEGGTQGATSAQIKREGHRGRSLRFTMCGVAPAYSSAALLPAPRGVVSIPTTLRAGCSRLCLSSPASKTGKAGHRDITACPAACLAFTLPTALSSQPPPLLLPPSHLTHWHILPTHMHIPAA